MTQPLLDLHPALAGSGESATIAINARSRALAAAGRRVHRLGLGQSPFPVPRSVVAALQDHAHEKDYLPTRGLPALREAVAEHFQRRQGLTTAADQVLIGPGSKELLFLLQLVCRAELVVPTPSWVSYAPQAAMLGLPVRWLETTADGPAGQTAERLDALCRGGPARPRLLILNYPNNPTGASFGPLELEQIAAVARRHRLLVLSDEIYGELHFSGDHHSLARWYPEGTCVSGGLSKWCGAGGWRLGTLILPEGLTELGHSLAVAASETFTAVSAPVQHAAVQAFRGGPEIEAYLADSRRILRALLGAGRELLLRGGARLPEPCGGFYLMPCFEAHRAALARIGVDSGPALAERLLDDLGLACLPGSAFGLPTRELTLRLALVDFDGAAALKAARTAAAVGEDFLERCCAPTLGALRDLGRWLEAL